MDTELVKRAQHGDREAFGLVAADIATRFLAVSRRIQRNIDLAEDATQQALVAIWRDLPQLRDPLGRPQLAGPALSCCYLCPTSGSMWV